MSANSLKVVIDARLVPGQPGGVEMFVAGLARGIRDMKSESEEYYYLVRRSVPGWLEEHAGPEAHFLQTRASSLDSALALTSRTPSLRRSIARGYARVVGASPTYALRASDGVVESAGMQVIHFPFQGAFTTSLPSIYHPHDLQHEHLPEMFTARERRARDELYRLHCHRASIVAVASEWIRDDVVEKYGLSPEKVVVVPLAPPVDAERRTPQEALPLVDLPPVFFLYPAQTWPHKNHLALLDALSLLRDSGTSVGLVCPGKLTSHSAEIMRKVTELDLASRVRFLGFVSDAELAHLYRMAVGVVVPSLFEAASFPVWEAFAAGVPVAAANTTSLPSQIGDAGLVFDGRDPQSIARAMESIMKDETMRSSLVARGRRRVSQYHWVRTARHFRALYRSLGGVPPTDEDFEVVRSAPVF